MQPIPSRLGLGLRPPLPSYGQGPSMSALAQQQQMLHQGFVPPQAQKQTTLFVGSISGGVTDSFLNRLLAVSRQCVVHRPSIQLILPVASKGMWPRQILQTSHHASEQAPGLWFRRV